MKLKNKKAFALAPETIIKILIALLCILILLFLLNSMYGIFQWKSEKERAEAQLETIVRLINRVEEEESLSHVITNPKNWHLLTFSGEKRVCFCPLKTEWIWKEFDNSYWKETCKKDGVCKDTEEEVSFDMRYYAEDASGKERIWAEYGLITFYPKAIYISKENEKTVIRDYNEQEYDLILRDIINLIGTNDMENKIKTRLGEAEKEKGRKMAVIVGYKDGTGEIVRKEVIPDENKIKEISLPDGRNFVIPGDKDEKTAVFLIVERK